MAFTAAEWASTPIQRVCDGYVTPLKWTLRRRFIDVTPMELSKIACYTPMIFNLVPRPLHTGFDLWSLA